MEKIEGKSISNQDVALDGRHYEDCTFTSCTFIYAATDRFGLNNNSIANDCRFLFIGAASDTLNTLKALYSAGDWGRVAVLNTLQDIVPDIKKLH